jgi:hypothetical protein
MKPVAGSTRMKPVLDEAVRREYDRGIANCSVETAASITAPAKLILDLMPIIIENLELSMAWVCVDRLDLAAPAIAGGTFGARSKTRYNFPKNFVE